MPITINGTTGVAGVAGSAGTPTFQGTSTTAGVFYPAANTVSISTNSTEAMRVDSSQNVGIGTSSPSARLHVYGTSAETLRFQSTSSAPYQTFYNSSANRAGYIEWNTSALKIDAESGASSTIAFLTANNERARIDSNGAFGVGMTGPSGYGIVGVRFTPSGGSHNQTGIGIETSLSTSGARFMQFYNEGGSGIGSITRNTTTNAVLYNTSSDYRLKEQIQPLSGALARVAQMRPSRWVWKDCAGATGEGFIAHELQQVVPGAVTGEKDGVDENGKPIYQGMDASYLVATLTAAIQEQQALINDLTARIAALEGAK